MRALYIEDINVNEKLSELSLESSQLLHLSKVVRLKEEDPLLILDGRGNKFFGKLKTYKKKSILFELDKKIEEQRKFDISLALVMPKKDAFEEILQKSVQLGINTIHTFSSQFSQYEFFKISDRVRNILLSAQQQSNNPFRLKLVETRPLAELLKVKNDYDEIIYFSSQSKSSEVKDKSFKKGKRILFVIGPEGGLTVEEEKFLKEAGVIFMHLSTPIMRSSTAVTTALGFLLGRYSELLDA